MAEGGDKKQMDKLLKMSLKLQDQETKDFSPTQLDEERRAFLDGAIKSVLDNSDEKKLHLFTSLFLRYKNDKSYTEAELVEVVNVFEELSFLVEGMDMAKEFNKLGGLKQCHTLLKSQYSSIQWRAADLIANCSQNNPPCQATMMECNGIVTLLHIIKTTDVDIVKLKCVFALSTLIGNYEEAENLFLKLKGIHTLLQLIQEDMVKIQIKSVFLIQKILQSEYEKDLDLRMICKELYSALHKKHNESQEMMIKIILNAITENESLVDDIFTDRSSDIEFLKERTNYLINIDGEKYLDEASVYGEILKVLSQ